MDTTTPQGDAPSQEQVDRVQLRRSLEEFFDLAELHTLCFDLGVDFENLPGDTKSEKVIALIEHLDHRERLPELVAAYKRDRPESERKGPRHPATAQSIALPALHQLPPPPRDFADREAELTELATALLSGGITISALHGMGGVGKTALALKLAEQLTPRCPDAQLFLDLKGASKTPLTPADAMRHVIRSYRPMAPLPEGGADLQSGYLSVLYGQRALLLLDDAADLEQVEPLLPPATCILLVTSRQHFVLPGSHPMDLDVLPPADACALLLHIAPSIGDQANAIARLCGYLPLALQVAASHLAESRDVDAATYVTQLHDERTRLEHLGTGGPHVSVEASLGLSYERLDQETARVFRQLAVFPGSFSGQAEEQVCQDADHAHLSDLLRRSMVEWDRTRARYHLHDLVHSFAHARLTEDEWVEGCRRHAHYFLGIAQQYRSDNMDQWRNLDADWSNVQAAANWLSEQMDHAEPGKADVTLAADFALALQRLIRVRRPTEGERWLRNGMSACRSLNRLADEGWIILNLGSVKFDQGRLAEATSLFEHSREIFEIVQDSKGLMYVHGNLGNVYCKRGEYKQAIASYRSATLKCRRVRDFSGEAVGHNNLGDVYRSLGNRARAIVHYNASARLFRHEGVHNSLSTVLANLAELCLEEGDSDQALTFAAESFKIAQDLSAQDLIGVAQRVLGDIWAHKGDTDKARGCFEESLRLLTESAVLEEVAGTHERYGYCLTQWSRLSEAKDHLDKAYQIYLELDSHEKAALVQAKIRFLDEQ